MNDVIIQLKTEDGTVLDVIRLPPAALTRNQAGRLLGELIGQLHSKIQKLN